MGAEDVTRAVAAERRRIAGRLHDGAVQELTAALLFLDSAVLAGAADRRVVDGVEALRKGIEECRRLMGELAEDP